MPKPPPWMPVDAIGLASSPQQDTIGEYAVPRIVDDAKLNGKCIVEDTLCFDDLPLGAIKQLRDLREELKAVLMGELKAYIDERLLVDSMDLASAIKINRDLEVSFPGSDSGTKSAFSTKIRASKATRASEASVFLERRAHKGMYAQTTAAWDMAIEPSINERSDNGFPLLDCKINELSAQDLTFSFSGSAWDAMMFIGIGVMPITDEICCLVIYLLNALMQSAFMGIVGANMTTNLFKNDRIVNTLQDWRVSYGHDPDYADKFTDKPLVQDICNRSSFIMHGARQGELYFTLWKYVQKFFGIQSGSFLCILALALWTLTVVTELAKSMLYSIAVWTPNEPNGDSVKRTHVEIKEKSLLWMYGEAGQKNYQLYVAPSRAAAMTMIVAIPRCFIMIYLWWIGCEYLIATLELHDLILNAVALEVILHVDELLFKTFGPDTAVRMVQKTMPLRVPRRVGILQKLACWSKILIFAAVMTALGFVLKVSAGVIADAENAICGGKTDFLAIELDFGPVVVAVPALREISRSSYSYQAVLDRTHQRHQPPLYVENHPFNTDDATVMTAWKQRKIADFAHTALSDPATVLCFDNFYADNVNPILAHPLLEGFRAKIQNRSVTNCADVAHLCYTDISEVGKAVRFRCPETCGLHSALSGQFLNLPTDGAPYACDERFTLSLAQASCRDPTKQELLQGPMAAIWKNYIDSMLAYYTPVLRAMVGGNVTLLTGMLLHMRYAFMTHGCDLAKQNLVMHDPGLNFTFTIDYCDPDEGILFEHRTLRPLCPQSCGCDTHVKENFAVLNKPWTLSRGYESQCPRACFD